MRASVERPVGKFSPKKLYDSLIQACCLASPEQKEAAAAERAQQQLHFSQQKQAAMALSLQKAHKVRLKMAKNENTCAAWLR